MVHGVSQRRKIRSWPVHAKATTKTSESQHRLVWMIRKVCRSRKTHLVLDVVQSELEHHCVGVVVPGHRLVVGRPHSAAFDGAREYHLHDAKKETEEETGSRGSRG